MKPCKPSQVDEKLLEGATVATPVSIVLKNEKLKSTIIEKLMCVTAVAACNEFPSTCEETSLDFVLFLGKKKVESSYDRPVDQNH